MFSNKESRTITVNSGSFNTPSACCGVVYLQMMIQDMKLGNGFACFDPHGDLIDLVLMRISS
jgi:hypothetical protein